MIQFISKVASLFANDGRFINFKERKNSMKSKVISSVVAAAFFNGGAYAAGISIDNVIQRWPWNNKVDITYTVTDAQVSANGVFYGLRFEVVANGEKYEFSGSSIGASAESGAGSKQHVATWTAPAGISCSDCSITATLFATNVPSGRDYMIVDLDSGDVYYEGLMETQVRSNERYNKDAYKNGGLMVLRRIPRWSDRASLPNASELTGSGYPTGDDRSFADSGDLKNDGVNSVAHWTPEQDYYMGVFPVTCCQYGKITGVGDDGKLPKTVSWNDVRDSLAPMATIPSDGSGNGFMAKLNTLTKSKCGVAGFDLPTEPMFEIACRSGSETTYFWGDELDFEYVISGDNCTENTDPGERNPNKWGLYGMSGGSVWQWCRDTFDGKSDLSSLYGSLFTPYGAEFGDVEAYRVRRGGGSYVDVILKSDKTPREWIIKKFFASYRTSARGVVDNCQGFRVAYVAKWGER